MANEHTSKEALPFGQSFDRSEGRAFQEERSTTAKSLNQEQAWSVCGTTKMSVIERSEGRGGGRRGQRDDKAGVRSSEVLRSIIRTFYSEMGSH